MNLKALILGSTALCSPTLAHLVPEELASARDAQIETLGVLMADAYREIYGHAPSASQLAHMIVAIDDKKLTAMDLEIASGMLRSPQTPMEIKYSWLNSMLVSAKNHQVH